MGILTCFIPFYLQEERVHVFMQVAFRRAVLEDKAFNLIWKLRKLQVTTKDH